MEVTAKIIQTARRKETGPISAGWWRWINGYTKKPNGRVLEPVGGNYTNRENIRSHSCKAPFGPSVNAPFCSAGCVTGTASDIQKLNKLMQSQEALYMFTKFSASVQSGNSLEVIEMRWRIYCCGVFFALNFLYVAFAQAQAPKNSAIPPKTIPRVLVPERVARLVLPLLDLRQKLQEQQEIDCGGNADPTSCADMREKKFWELFSKLDTRRDAASDEALVVLMCFYIGESQEEIDAVIGRGRRMLTYIEKYRLATPIVPGRAYPTSMLKQRSIKINDFAGAKKAIQKGWHSTADNPVG